jgi:hypothetical protein
VPFQIFCRKKLLQRLPNQEFLPSTTPPFSHFSSSRIPKSRPFCRASYGTVLGILVRFYLPHFLTILDSGTQPAVGRVEPPFATMSNNGGYGGGGRGGYSGGYGRHDRSDRGDRNGYSNGYSNG